MYYDEAQTNPLNDEIEWGLRYRDEKKKARRGSLEPKSSPINLQALWQKYQITKKIQELDFKKHIYAKPPPKHIHLKINDQINKSDRSAFTRKQYINFLSTPHRYIVPQKKSRSIVALRRKLRQKQKCTARLIELAKPTKLRVYNTWKDHWYGLPPVISERLNLLLQTDHTLDPAFARCCFKELDRKKNKEKYKKLKRRKLRNKKRRKENAAWLRTQIALTVDLFIDFLQRDALLSLNYKQMLVSNVILDKLVFYRCVQKRPMRNSNKASERSIIDIVDQLAVWMDTVARYIDVKISDSEELIEGVQESLLLESEEGEGEEEESTRYERFKQYEEGETDSYDGLHKYRDQLDTEWTETSEGEEDTTYKFEEKETSTEALAIKHDGTQVGKSHEVDQDILEKLISILSESPTDFLQEKVDEDNLPNITYDEVLHRVKNLRDEEIIRENKKRQEILENTLINWAKTNEPEEVDDKLIGKIHSAAQIISELLKEQIAFNKGATDVVTSTTWAGKEETVSRGDETTKYISSSKGTLTDTQKPLDTDHDIREITVQPEESDIEQWSDFEEHPTEKLSDHALSEEGRDQLSTGKIEERSVDIVKVTRPSQEQGVAQFGMIPKHDPPQTYEHAPDSVCCLTIKVWATWLLEVANNAEKWGEWLNNIIKEIRQIAAILRGEVFDDKGNMITFYQDDWNRFIDKVETMVIAWRQYNMHVKDLTDKIINNFHGKRITCCPKCLEDNLIVNIAVAHDISQQLAEAMNTASYWRRWLDSVVMDTERLTSAKLAITDTDAESEGTSSFAVMELIEIQLPKRVSSDESIYEIEEYEYCRP